MNKFAIAQEGENFVIGNRAATERSLSRDEVLELISWLGVTAKIGSSEYSGGVIATYEKEPPK